MMSDGSRGALCSKWFELIAMGATDRWPEVADAALTMRIPFSPPGLPTELVGLPACQEASAGLWQSFKSFAWTELDIFEAQQSNLVFATAKSRAETLWGAIYVNHYCFKIRIDDGKIIEQTEFFNPLPVMTVFKDHLGPAA
jgi:ketosteroid isomerase-like protein